MFRHLLTTRRLNWQHLRLAHAPYRHSVNSWKQVANCWKRELSVVVKRYPDEAKDLGATTNTQALLLHSLGHSEFLHVDAVRNFVTKSNRFIGHLEV